MPSILQSSETSSLQGTHPAVPKYGKTVHVSTHASHYVYSGILTKTVDSPEDFRPVAFPSGLFSEMQQRWSATENEANAVYQSILKFDLVLKMD